jgi:hypothetical protein
VAEATE